MKFAPIAALLLFCANVTYAKNVLVLCILSSPSHKNVFEPIVSGLAQKGHNVTIVSSWKPQKSRQNIREVIALPGFDYFPHMSTMEIRRNGIWGLLKAGQDHIYEACHQVYRNPEFMALLQEKWDVVLHDVIGNECLYGFGHRTGAPLVLVTTLPAPHFFTRHLGNHLPPSFVQDFASSFNHHMTFWQRVGNFAFGLLTPTWFTMQRPKMNEISREHLGPDTPEVVDILNNASLLLSNSHFTLNDPRPTMPDVVEVGGGHCRPGKPLPKDIEEFVNGSEHGFVFFSLGSIVKPHELSDDIRKVFLNTFRRLRFRVLWKWAEETMPDLPPNVKLLKWVPQQDVLAHPKIKLFMTHGGLLSLQEAVYHGVPVIGIPIFGDQDTNTDKAVQIGIGEKIEILTVTEPELQTAIGKATSAECKKRTAELSERFRDRNGNPADEGVYWIEYVMRHKGAQHLRSAARQLNFFQYHSLDVVGFLAVVILGILWVIQKLLVLTFRKILAIVYGKRVDAKGEKKRN